MRRLSFLFLIIFVSSLGLSAQQITFRDITAQAGIHFTHNNAAFGKKYLPETMGPGCAFIDYDNDGWPDILLVNDTNSNEHYLNKHAPTLDQKDHSAAFTYSTHDAARAGTVFDFGDSDGDC